MVPASDRRYAALAWMSSCASTVADVTSAARSMTASSTIAAVDHRLDVRQAARAIAQADDADMGVDRLAGRILVVEQRRRRHREIAAAARELAEAPAALRRPGRQPDLGDDLVVLERGRQRPDEEVVGADRARPLRAGRGDLGVAGDGDAGHLGGGIGMRDAAADGAAVADLIVRDVLNRGLQQRMGGRQTRVVLDVAPAHHGAEPHTVGGYLDLLELRQLAQVDEQRRRDHAEREHRHQALAAGDRPRIPAAGSKQRDRFGKARRAGVFERRQLHDSVSFGSN